MEQEPREVDGSCVKHSAQWRGLFFITRAEFGTGWYVSPAERETEEYAPIFVREIHLNTDTVTHQGSLTGFGTVTIHDDEAYIDHPF